MGKSEPPRNVPRRHVSLRPKILPLSSLMPLAKSLMPGASPSLAPSPRPTTPPRSTDDAKARRRWSALAWAAPAVLVFAAGGWLASKNASRSSPTRGAATATVKTVDSGAHVRWHRDAIDVAVDQTFLDLAGPEVFGNAIDAWRATGAVLPSVSTMPATGRQVGYDPSGANENVVVFAQYGWAKANGALAVTVVTYEDSTGAIIDADLLVNGGGRFFANFDHDESGSDDDSIPIENSAVDPSVPQVISGQTPRFDVQSVVTHELGHLLGLGDDQDDSMATMYARTAAGEIHKRLLTATDAKVITSLYAEAPSSAQAQTGCGGAHLSAAAPDESWTGVAAAVAGLLLLAFARRGPKRAGALGAALMALGTLGFLTPPDVERNIDTSGWQSDAKVRIVGAATRRVDGILQTALKLHVTTCQVASCPDEEQQIMVWGGKLDGKTQVVGPFTVPELGTEVAVRLRDGRGLMKALSPRFQP
jgi:hypothetical protein